MTSNADDADGRDALGIVRHGCVDLTVIPETAMYTPREQPHYTPSSVGALMDPAFLRRAVRDAQASGHAAVPPVKPAATRWQRAMRAVAAFFARQAGR